MDKASATEIVNVVRFPVGSNQRLQKKLAFTAFLLDVQLLKRLCEASTVSGTQVAAYLDGRKVSSLSPSRGNWVNKGEITIKNIVFIQIKCLPPTLILVCNEYEI